jgi:hypothetical protein
MGSFPCYANSGTDLSVPWSLDIFFMTAERSNRIAQAAVAEAMAPLMLW